MSGAIITTGFWERHKPVHIYDIYCNGTEKKILECRHNTINNPQSCLSYFSDDASVQCQGINYSDKCIHITFVKNTRKIIISVLYI